MGNGNLQSRAVYRGSDEEIIAAWWLTADTAKNSYQE